MELFQAVKPVQRTRLDHCDLVDLKIKLFKIRGIHVRTFGQLILDDS